MDIKGFCRLCFVSKKNMLNIFDKTGVELNISNILSSHFWFEVLETDELSKNVCEECWQCTIEFHKFYCKVRDTYDKYFSNQLETCIVKIEETSIDDIPDCKNNVETILGSPRFILCESSTVSSLTDKNVVKEKETVHVKRKRRAKRNEKVKVSKKRAKSSLATELTESYPETIAETSVPVKVTKIEIDLRNEVECKSTTYDEKSEASEVVKDIDLHRETENSVESNSNRTDENEVDDSEEKIRQFCSMQCDLCDYTFDTYLTAKQHYRSVHKISGYVKCCKRKFSRRCRILDHIEHHLNPYAFKCDVCGKTYSNKRTIRTHLETHLPQELRPYKCSVCPKAFSKNYKLSQHKRFAHISEGDKKFQCSDCDKSFITRHTLSFHIRAVHECAFTQICDICAKVFKSKQVLKDHLAKHFGEEPVKLQCNLCGAWLMHKRSLRSHMARHQETTQKCSICNKEAPTKNALRSHMKYVHTERTHSCTMCDKKFKKPVELQEHLATHTGESLYTCPYCPQTFKSNANMFAHRKKSHPLEWQQDRSKRIISC